VKLIDNTNKHPLFIATLAAETCYASYGKHEDKEKQYVAKLIASGHTSILEHWWVVIELDWVEVIYNIDEYIEVVSQPGVVNYTKDNSYFVLLNWRHLYDLKDNEIVQKIISLIRNEISVEVDIWK